MNFEDPAAWLGMTGLIAIVGSWIIWWLIDRDQARHETETRFWEEAMQPNRFGDLASHTPPDALESRPLLPEEYDR